MWGGFQERDNVYDIGQGGKGEKNLYGNKVQKKRDFIEEKKRYTSAYKRADRYLGKGEGKKGVWDKGKFPIEGVWALKKLQITIPAGKSVCKTRRKSLRKKKTSHCCPS